MLGLEPSGGDPLLVGWTVLRDLMIGLSERDCEDTVTFISGSYNLHFVRGMNVTAIWSTFGSLQVHVFLLDKFVEGYVDCCFEE